MRKDGKGTKLTITIKEIQEELGVSRRVATAWATQYLHFKQIGRQYLFSRREFEEVINANENIIYEITY